MKKFLSILLISLVAASLAIPAFAAEGTPFAEFIQAEDLKVDGAAVSVATVDGAIGGKALLCNEKQDDASGTGFTLTFTVPADGDYVIWGRAFYPSVSNNSLHYSVEGGDSMVWDFADEDAGAACYDSWQYFYLTKRLEGTFSDTTKYGTWSIENNQWRHAPNVLSLTKGEHSIHFTGREAGWYLDELVITELAIEDYDPNYYAGNNFILDPCKFCGTEWKHYYKDIFAATGETAENYFYNTLYKIEVEEAPAEAAAADTPAAAAPAAATSAPQTSDPGMALLAVLSILSLGGTMIALRKNKVK